MAGTVAVVTDSTACLTAELAASHDIRVVPLQVVLAGQVHDETSAAGGDVNDVAVAAARRSERLRSLFWLASLGHLRHGGRMGGAAAPRAARSALSR